MNKELIVIYVYKGINYDTAPIRYYYIDSVIFSNGVKYFTIRKKIPVYIHLFIIIILLTPLIKVNYEYYSKESIQVRKHTLRIPDEMYYDFDTKILDIDITNDGSNFEIISFSIQDSGGKSILDLNGINPGESIGSIPVNYEFKQLPIICKIVYKTSYKGSVFKNIVKDVSIVDRAVADNDINRDF